MDESVISGANVFYPDQFDLPEGTTRDWYVGLINGAPYLCRSVTVLLDLPLLTLKSLTAVLSLAAGLVQPLLEQDFCD